MNLPPHLVQQLHYVEIATSRRMRNLRAGTFQSRTRGTGFDFDEHRLYRPGDDVRRIDWNVTARLRQPFVRETHAERELNVTLALDLSASMDFGTAGFDKKELMFYVAACLAFSAAADQVNLGLLAFGRDVIEYWPPRRSKARVWRALDELWALGPDPGPTAMAPVVSFLHRRLRHASVVFLLSDFLTKDSLAGMADLRLLAAAHDVVAVVVEDRAELELFRAGGDVRVRDPETGVRRRLALTGRTKRRVRTAMNLRRQRLVDAFYDAGIDHAFLSDMSQPLAAGGDPPLPGPLLEPLLELFSTRRRAS